MSLNVVSEELNNLPPVVASDILSEVTHEDNPEPIEYYDEDVVVPDQETLELIEDVTKNAEEFKATHKKLKKLVDPHKIAALKVRFGVSQGVRGHSLLIGKMPMNWEDFVRFFYDCTPRHLNRLLNIEDEKPTNVRQPDPAKSRNYQLGYDSAEAKFEDWKRKQLAAGIVFKSDCALPKSTPVATPAFDKQDPYAYWEQFREEPETLSGELVAMLSELGLDYQQMLKVVELMKKEAKAQAGQPNTKGKAATAA